MAIAVSCNVACMSSNLSTSIEVAPSELRSSLCTLRLCAPEAEKQMQLSLSKLGQMTPVMVWPSSTGKELEIFDGMKRWRAAQALSWPKLRVFVHALDAAGAKVRLLQCNVGTALSDLEEAWVVRSLYREDKLNQPQIAQLLNHDKSWVCRKLTLAEGLSDELTANVRLGLLSATAAVELGQLQRCNQDAAAQVVMRRGLTTRQASSLVQTLRSTPQEQWPKLFEQIARPLPLENKPPQGPKGTSARRTPGEHLCADAHAMKRLSVRLQARLLERSLQSHGPSACTTISGELTLLHAALQSLQETLALRLQKTDGATDAAA